MAFGVNLRKSSRENDLFADAVYFSSFLIKSIGYDWEWGTPHWRSWWNVEFVFISDKPLQNAATPNNMSLAVNNYQQGKVQKNVESIKFLILRCPPPFFRTFRHMSNLFYSFAIDILQYMWNRFYLAPMKKYQCGVFFCLCVFSLHVSNFFVFLSL